MLERALVLYLQSSVVLEQCCMSSISCILQLIVVQLGEYHYGCYMQCVMTITSNDLHADPTIHEFSLQYRLSHPQTYVQGGKGSGKLG